ncbi:MAG: flagellar hook-basal body complex protein [bacterium]|nr:flagellar hook-basal body complex protein [bacterium]
MMRSLYAGVSGIRNYQTWLDVIGNNIANVNTIGFKSSRATFAEMLTQTLRSATSPGNGFGGVNPMQIGLGVKIASVDTQFQQGTLESTGNYTDLAIQGDGFFVVTDGIQNYFTRSGAFNIDADGYMTAQGGTLRVQGYMADQLGMIATNLAPSAIQIPFGMKAPASATTQIDMYCNLDAEGTDSTATLLNAGSTGVSMVSGVAQNGAGGTHEITITGLNATQGSGMGANVGLAPLTLSTQLDDPSLGITDFDNFEIAVDGGVAVPITGLEAGSNQTVQDLINAINAQVDGVDASLDASGEIKLTRTWHGSGTEITMSGDIADQIFGGAAFVYADGDASTLVAEDAFTPSQGGSPIVTNLTLQADETTGLITTITDIGGGGVTVLAANGLAAGALDEVLTIETADTSHTTSIVTYDSLGGEHVMNVTFTKTATPNIWSWEAGVEEPAQIISGNTGTVTFNDDGSLQSFNYAGGVLSFAYNPNNGAAPIVNVDLKSGTPGGVDGITQFSSPSTTMVQSQNGYGMGTLNNVYIDENGTVLGSFSNDQTLTLAQIVLADFHNAQGLTKEGDNLYKMSANSGDAIYGLAQTNLGSSIYSGYVEMSNVDLSKQFADMIIAQRGFQASARVITTADTVLDEVIRLKR